VATKRKLVVIGNGMAGARTVEEILERGGGEPQNKVQPALIT
jgi:nitrite reductase (NADH) large subunit